MSRKSSEPKGDSSAKGGIGVVESPTDGMWVLRRGSFGRSMTDRFAIINDSSVQVYRNTKDANPYRCVKLTPECRVGDVQERSKCWTTVLHFHDKGKEKSLELGHRTEERANMWNGAVEEAISAMKAHSEVPLATPASNLTAPNLEDSPSISSNKSNPLAVPGVRKSLPDPRSLREYGRTPATIKLLLDEQKATITQALERKAQETEEQEREVAGAQAVTDTVNFYGWRTFSVEGGLRIRIDDDLDPVKHLAESKEINRAIQGAAAVGIALATLMNLLWVGDVFVSLGFGLLASLLVLYRFMVQSNLEGQIPTLQAAEIVRGSAEVIFNVIRDTKKWVRIDGCAVSWNVVEKVDEHQDVVHVVLKPVWKWVVWLRPRDLCLLRYWRREEDGSFLIIYQSTAHHLCPPKPDYVRASLPGAVWTIAPRVTPGPTDWPDFSRVTFTVKYDPTGFSSWWTRFGRGLGFVLPLLRNVTALKDAMSYQDYVPMTQDGVVSEGDDDISIEAESSEHFRPSVNPQGLVLGVRKLDCSAPPHFWAEPHASKFLVRGPNYFKDRKKINAGPSGFNLVGLDVLSFEDPTQRYNLASRPDNIVYQINRDGNPGCVPYTFVVNFVVPCTDNLAVVCYFQPAQRNWRETKNTFTELLNDFIDGDDNFRNNRFKLIPKIQEGPFVLRKAVAGKPAIIGNKGLRLPYYEGDNWFEVDIDVNSDAHARELTGMAIGVTKSIVVDIAFVIEPQSEEELPETILGAIRFNRIDLKAAMKRIPKHLPTTDPPQPAPMAGFGSMERTLGPLPEYSAARSSTSLGAGEDMMRNSSVVVNGAGPPPMPKPVSKSTPTVAPLSRPHSTSLSRGTSQGEEPPLVLQSVPGSFHGVAKRKGTKYSI